MNVPPSRRRFQFPLYMLMMLTMVIAMALAPASYFLRADADDRRTRMFTMALMIAGPMLMIVVLNVMYYVFQRLRRR